MQSNNTVCSQYISQGSLIYVPGDKNIAELEEHAEATIRQLDSKTDCYNQMVQFVCHSYLAPCYLETPTPRTMCPHSCDAAVCGSEAFRKIQTHLPEWSSARSCSSLKQTIAGSPTECIHLSAPQREQEIYTDGEWAQRSLIQVLACLLCIVLWFLVTIIQSVRLTISIVVMVT